jgi:site-specific DNA-cytosine methylase
MMRRERRAGRKLDPIFRKSLSQTLRFWFSVAAALGTPKQRAIAPRYAPKLADIRGVTVTDRYYVARNLTWTECERLMGFPDGWTAAEGDSLATQ